MPADVQIDLFPEIQPFHNNWLQVDPLHRVYFEECGNPNGPAVIFYMAAQEVVATRHNVVFLTQSIIIFC